LAVALSIGCATIAGAEVRLRGTSAAIQVTTSQDKVADVLAAVSARFNLKLETFVPLDADARRSYAGSLEEVISRLLEGYNYVVAVRDGSTEIMVFGARGEAVMPPSPAPQPGVLSRWK
jgi:hypothetical protein